MVAVEIDKHACATLRHNRPNWNVQETDLIEWILKDASNFKGVDLIAGGVPCPPFSIAGKQLGAKDERDLFPALLDLVAIVQPKAVMIENVRGLLDPKFSDYRNNLNYRFKEMGYSISWTLLNASDFGVSQLRPRVVAVAFQEALNVQFNFPEPFQSAPLTVGELLYDLMSENGWRGAKKWAETANKIAPTLVGGSKKHGGPDLGPSRARKAWEQLGVNGSTIAVEAPEPEFLGNPRLTVQMAARVQGFPDQWHFTGAKTNAYRQVGNAFPPPVAKAVGLEIVKALNSACNVWNMKAA